MSAVPEKETLWDEEVRPYIRPTMAEVRAIPWNGLRAVSTFSGCGGSSLGLRMAGFRVPYAVEFVPAAADTYEANSDAYVDRRDVREIRGIEVKAQTGLYQPGELDLFEGSPPCANFSAAGAGDRYRDRECEACKGHGEIESVLTGRYEACEACEGKGRFEGSAKAYSDTTQRSDDLFFEFERLMRVLHPRAFVAENVPGLIRGAAIEKYAHVISRKLSEAGYRVQAKVLNASWYGTPQDRRRLIFVGIRDDQDVEWEWPAREPERYSLRTALDAVDPEDPDHASFLAESSMERFAVGRAWRILSDGGSFDYCLRCALPVGELTTRGTTRPKDERRCECEEPDLQKDYFMLTVPKLDEPCPTLTATAAQAGAASVAHPTECRKLTPAECKAICGFPPDFVLTGTREQRVERMGRAVPPPMYAAIGRKLTEVLS